MSDEKSAFSPLPPRPTPPLTVQERQARMEEDMKALARVQIMAGAPASVPPPAPPRSIPVEAVKQTYRLSRAASAFVGVLYAIAEYSTEQSLIRIILRAVFGEPN